jgi:hypothetical protein
LYHYTVLSLLSPKPSKFVLAQIEQGTKFDQLHGNNLVPSSSFTSILVAIHSPIPQVSSGSKTNTSLVDKIENAFSTHSKILAKLWMYPPFWDVAVTL